MSANDRTAPTGAPGPTGAHAPGATADTTATPTTGSLVELIRGITDDTRRLVQQETLLARQELAEAGSKAGQGGALLLAAGVLLGYMLTFLLATLAWGMVALGLPAWAALGIITLLLLLLAVVLALVGRYQLQAAKGAPEQARGQLQGLSGWLRGLVGDRQAGPLPESRS